MKIILVLISIVLLAQLISCEKETGGENKYVIFTADSSGVYGKILNDPKNEDLYPDRPYKVFAGQRILFDREYSSNTNRFEITADIGKYNYFTSENQYHYRLTNDYILVVK